MHNVAHSAPMDAEVVGYAALGYAEVHHGVHCGYAFGV